mgnify:CR=1 FL=1
MALDCTVAPTYFNSRPCGRGDREDAGGCCKQAISIHAPAGGATLWRAYCRRGFSYFNSRPCGRGDLGNGGIISASNLFQFTPLREGRPTPTRPESLLTNFNSRPCGRGDAVFQIIARRDFYFNSRPCGRGDRKRLQSFPQQLLFQFTPLREGRPTPTRPESLLTNFNSRPCGRGDAVFQIIARRDFYFNSRPCGRGDRKRLQSFPQQLLFQFTPLREGRPAALMSAVWMIFQFTPLREGRRDYRTTIAGARLFQFTPLREGRRPGDV